MSHLLSASTAMSNKFLDLSFIKDYVDLTKEKIIQKNTIHDLPEAERPEIERSVKLWKEVKIWSYLVIKWGEFTPLTPSLLKSKVWYLSEWTCSTFQPNRVIKARIMSQTEINRMRSYQQA